MARESLMGKGGVGIQIDASIFWVEIDRLFLHLVNGRGEIECRAEALGQRGMNRLDGTADLRKRGESAEICCRRSSSIASGVSKGGR
jgi:hypothetical protein